MPTMTIDDQIAEERAKAGALETDLASRRAAVASSEAELARLEADNPHGANPGWSSRATAEWYRARSRAEERRGAALRGIEDVKRLEQESTGWAAELEKRRVPKFDDAIAEARARLAEIPQAIGSRTVDARELEARLRGYAVAEAVGDPVTAGEPAASRTALEEGYVAVGELEAERARLELRVAMLLERRQSAVVEIVDAERQRIAERWDALAGEALADATRLHAIAIELEQLEDEHRAAGARHGLPGGGIASVGDQRLDPDGLERAIVNVARGLALRAPVG